MKKILLLFVLFAVTTASYAGQWIGPYSVTRIDTSDGSLHFLRAEGFPNPDNCPNSLYVEYQPTGKLVDRVLATGLTAKAIGKQVRHWISGCTPAGYINATTIEIWD